jgi:hypothetical protein
MRLLVLLVGIGAVLSVATGQAQTYVQPGTTPVMGHTARYPANLFLEYQYGNQGGGYGGSGGGDTATTPIQGIDYGIARIIRSEGVYNYLSSEAALTLTEAQRREIENWRLWTETYFEMRRLNREARAAERGPAPTPADFVRYAQIGKPRRLGPSELDSITGQIYWPLMLQLPEFTPFRTEVQRVFAQRASTGAIDGTDYLKVYDTVAMMKTALQQRIRELPPMDYIAARRFLESLSWEARMPAI